LIHIDTYWYILVHIDTYYIIYWVAVINLIHILKKNVFLISIYVLIHIDTYWYYPNMTTWCYPDG
jgi:hypothetical protein